MSTTPSQPPWTAAMLIDKYPEHQFEKTVATDHFIPTSQQTTALGYDCTYKHLLCCIVCRGNTFSGVKFNILAI
jgi:hypothetical protein